MDSSLRAITSLPLAELFNEQGRTPHRRDRDLYADCIRGLLRRAPIQFVVADVGHRPVWIPLSDCYDFFKWEVKNHLAESNEQVHLDDFPDSYFYRASQWQAGDDSTVVVLEKQH
jgi:hypothetical protein